VRDLPRPWSVRASVIALLVAAPFLGGCTEKHEASTALPSTSAAETTESLPTVGPADFPVPDEARTKDAAGAEAFLRYWIDLMNRQRAIPAGKPLRDLGPHCNDCQRVAKVYDNAATAGRRFTGGKLTLVSSAPAFIDGNSASINFLAAQEALALVNGEGAAIESLPSDQHLGSGLSLIWSEGDRSWLVTGFTIG
jgi:hypothetical protein